MSDSANILVIVFGAISIVSLIAIIWNARRQSERMRRQLDAVEAAEGEVRRLLDELPEAVLLVDNDHIVHSTNAAALGLFDLSRSELVTSDLLEHTDGDEQAQLAVAIQRAFEGDDVDPIQIEVRGGATRRVVVEASFHLPRHSPVFDQERRLVVRLRDVSEREQQSRALDQARRLATEDTPADDFEMIWIHCVPFKRLGHSIQIRVAGVTARATDHTAARRRY